MTPLLKNISNYEQYQASPFLQNVEVHYGPVDVLGRLFLIADAAARKVGITLSFASMEQLVAVNRANSDSWSPLLPIFDPECFDASEENSFCIVGKASDGKIVATHAARLYFWPETNFADEAASLRLFYKSPDKMKLPGESCQITAPSAKDIGGSVVFSGSAWYHPDHRGCGLSSILPRIGKALALTRWLPDSTVSFMARDVYERGFAEKFGYNGVDWEVKMKNSRLGNLDAAIVTSTPSHVAEYLTNYVSESLGAQIDGTILNRSA